jgi:hypothetical protein
MLRKLKKKSRPRLAKLLQLAHNSSIKAETLLLVTVAEQMSTLCELEKDSQRNYRPSNDTTVEDFFKITSTPLHQSIDRKTNLSTFILSKHRQNVRSILRSIEKEQLQLRNQLQVYHAETSKSKVGGIIVADDRCDLVRRSQGEGCTTTSILPASNDLVWQEPYLEKNLEYFPREETHDTNLSHLIDIPDVI